MSRRVVSAPYVVPAIGAVLMVMNCGSAALANAASDALGYVDIGKKLTRTGHTTQGRGYITKAIQTDPTCSAAYFERALDEQIHGNFDKAFADFKMAVKTDPKNGMAAFNSGKMCVGRALDPDAIKFFTIACNDMPKNADPYIERGKCYRKASDFKKAIADFTTAIAIDSASKSNYLISAYILRADAYAGMHDYNKQIADLTAVLKLEPENDRAHMERANAYRNLNQPDKAIAEYTQVIKEDPQSIPAYVVRGGVYSTEKQYDKALADFSTAIKLDPYFGFDAYNARAKVYDAMGKPSLAAQDRQKAQAIYKQRTGGFMSKP
jgi:tetratricopeptide (TPR) repeat protein